MTRDYLYMKLLEAKDQPLKYYPYIVLCVMANLTINPMIEHLNKRGLFSNYWVVNDDDEIHRIIDKTKV